jgi:hypothetical protein
LFKPSTNVSSSEKPPNNEHKDVEPEDDDDRDLVDKQLGQIGDYPIGEIDTRGDPKLYVDVNIGKSGGMERIVVYEGDTADGLAKEFCTKNGLN